jgi:hypothetical protein
MQDDSRIERMISLAERLIVALEGDIAALKEGRTAELSTNDPEIQKLSVIYGREAQGFDLRIAQAAPASLRQRFVTITAKFREVLQLHARMVTRLKNATEGMVRAIASEIDRVHAPSRTYGPRPGYKAATPPAMIFNRVV